MKRFVLTKPAERDLDEIKNYLVENAGPAIARRLDLLGLPRPPPPQRGQGHERPADQQKRRRLRRR
jgi:hypothetical protein